MGTIKIDDDTIELTVRYNKTDVLKRKKDIEDVIAAKRKVIEDSLSRVIKKQEAELNEVNELLEKFK